MDKTKDEIEVERLKLEENIEGKYPSLNVQISSSTGSMVTFNLGGGNKAKAELLGDFYDSPIVKVREVGVNDNGNLRVIIDNLVEDEG